jgi:chemotaxis protein methyltransferase CheR
MDQTNMEPAIGRDTQRSHDPLWIDKFPVKNVDQASALAQAIVDTIRDPLLVLDQNLHVVTANRSFYQTFGMVAQNVRGRPLYGLGDGQWDIPELRLLLVDVAPQHAVMQAYEVERDFPDIGRRTMLLNAREVYNHRNAEKLILLAIEDITERCDAERLTAQLLRQKETLLQEMQHRVANSLQIIASVLLLKMQSVLSEETRLHLRDAHQRVMSVATVQQQLQASGHGEPIEVGPYLSRLCDTLGASMIGDKQPIFFKVEAGPGTAASDELVSIGLMTTELVINALKHGFPNGAEGGEISVRYGADECNWRLSVSDNGIGVQTDAGARGCSGLGTTIVQALAHQLKATVDITRLSPGMAVSITHVAQQP